jgi:glycosyltransferase involved in cell wall biosynthesis
LQALIQAYKIYLDELGEQGFDLVLVGAGELDWQLRQDVASMGLTHRVHFPGFVQYGELPLYYGMAEALVHASSVEQWGLVVNEAMASGLPVIVSNRCGCAADLVQAGANGITFNPYDVNELAGCLVQMSGMSRSERDTMGARGREIIAAWSPARFGASLVAAAKKAVDAGPTHPTFLDRSVLRLLAQRRV